MTGLPATMLCAAMCLIAGGCVPHSSRSDVTTACEPWCGVASRASATRHARSDGAVVVRERLTWSCPSPGDDVDAVGVAQACNEFLKQRGHQRVPERLALDGSPWPHPELRDGEVLTPPLLRFAETASIVCLNPVVVLMVDRPMDVTRDQARSADVFAYGYLRSTTIRGSGVIQWFSPTSNVGPEVLLSAGQSEAAIPILSGELVVTRSGENVVVTTRPAGDAHR